MENKLQIFKSPEFGDIQTLEVNGKIYFPATKCAEILGYKEPEYAVRTHCKEDGCVKHTLTDRLGRNQSVKFISEGNLYRLIVRSKLPSAERFESGFYALAFGSKLPRAKEFKRWITSEVLPTIRKHGVYATPEFLEILNQLISCSFE